MTELSKHALELLIAIGGGLVLLVVLLPWLASSFSTARRKADAEEDRPA